MFCKAFIFVFFATAQFLIPSNLMRRFRLQLQFHHHQHTSRRRHCTSPRSILTLNNRARDSIVRALYPSKISAASSTSPVPFSTSFIVSLVPDKNRYGYYYYYYGFAFVFLPSSETFATDFGVEFGRFAYNNNVSIKGDSFPPISSAVAGFYGGRDGEIFTELKLNSGENYQAWIEFNGSAISVTMSRAGSRKPIRPLISIPLNLTGVLLDGMFVGFIGYPGARAQSHRRIISWSFSNSNFSIGDALITKNLPSFKLPDDSVLKSKGFIAGVSVSTFLLLVSVTGLLCFYVIKRRRRGLDEDVEDWETEYWPHRVRYRDVFEATKGFSEENMIGYGGNSKVYRGVLEDKEVAVKRIVISPRESVAGTSEFLAEVSSLGRLRHRNIVGLKGWCKKGGESLILVYEYMENGSIDKRIFDCDEMLNWEQRMRVIRDVASGMLYLHEGWESKVLHRDIKSSNVLLDKDMNAKVGDFGLAKLQNTRKEMVSTTHVVGTVGYMAPELVKTGRASAQTDVYSFGVFVLEVVCGRRPIEEGREGIVEWMWGLMEKDKVVDGLDERIKARGRFETKDVEMALRIGLFCVHHDPRVRPKMRQVVQILEQGRLSDDGDERGRDGMKVSLLDRMKSFNLLGIGWGRQQQHPTFQDIWNSSTHSMSFATSVSVFLGR